VKISRAPPLQQNRSFRWRRVAAPPWPASPNVATAIIDRLRCPRYLPTGIPSHGDLGTPSYDSPGVPPARSGLGASPVRSNMGCHCVLANRMQWEHFHPISFSLPKMEDEQMKTFNSTRPWLARIKHIALIASETEPSEQIGATVPGVTTRRSECQCEPSGAPRHGYAGERRCRGADVAF
jgi:hypothetical protein